MGGCRLAVAAAVAAEAEARRAALLRASFWRFPANDGMLHRLPNRTRWRHFGAAGVSSQSTVLLREPAFRGVAGSQCSSGFRLRPLGRGGLEA